MKKVSLALLGLTLSFFLMKDVIQPARALAQEGIHLTLNLVDTSDFPSSKAYFTVTDANGLPIVGLQPNMFMASEDGQPIADFTATEIDNSDQPIRVVLAIDTSESIRTGSTTALSDIKTAAADFLQRLAPQDEVGLITFSDTANVVIPLTTDHASVVAAVNDLTPHGRTVLYDALVTSVDQLKNLPPGRKAIIILTDGVDDGSQFTLSDAADAAARYSIPVYPIGFGSVDQAAMEKIARLTGGHAQTTPDTKTLQQEFTTVLDTLRRQYLVEFISRYPATGDQHTLTITLSYQGVQINGNYQFTAQAHSLSVTLEGLTQNQPVGGQVKLFPDIIPSRSVAQVDYSVDGNHIQTVHDKPFTYTWDVSAIPEGQHTLHIQVTDTSGNSGEQDISLHIRPLIKVTWVSPTADSTVQGPTQKVEANIDALAGVAKVEFYVDKNLAQTVTTPPYAFDWPLVGLGSGPHLLSARVTDVNNFTYEDTITVNVSLGGTWAIVVVIALVAAAGILVLSFANRRRQAGGPVAGLASPQGGATTGAVLHEIRGINSGRDWPVGDHELRIGRKTAENDVPAEGKRASRKHAVIQRVEGVYMLYNLRQDNPTMINNQAVSTRQVLKSGDLIEIGDSAFRFDIPST